MTDLPPPLHPAAYEAMTDAELLDVHVAGDHRAFGVLFTRHRGHLWCAARRYSVSPDDAEDALQEGMIKAFVTARAFRKDCAVRSWLHRIVANCALDILRRKRSQRQLVTSVADELTATAAPLDPMATLDLAMSMTGILDCLSPELRAAVVAVDIDGMSVAEAAELLGVPTGTIKSRCARGRTKLALAAGHLRPRQAGDDVPGTPGERSAGSRTTDPHSTDTRSPDSRSA